MSKHKFNMAVLVNVSQRTLLVFPFYHYVTDSPLDVVQFISWFLNLELLHTIVLFCVFYSDVFVEEYKTYKICPILLNIWAAEPWKKNYYRWHYLLFSTNGATYSVYWKQKKPDSLEAPYYKASWWCTALKHRADNAQRSYLWLIHVNELCI